MGINRTLWARACSVMGPEYAAAALAIVSTKQQGQESGQIQSTRGGYFAGMVKKFEKNPQDLCLSRTLWRLKDEAWGKDGHAQPRQIEKQRRIEMRTKNTRIRISICRRKSPRRGNRRGRRSVDSGRSAACYPSS